EVTRLVSFTGTNGFGPSDLVKGSDGNFYGTTFQGGTSYVSVFNSGGGTIFKVTPNGVHTVLMSFNSTLLTGFGPRSGLIQASDGDFYGTTSYGGTNGAGTLFKITPTGVLTTLASFAGPY